VKKGYFLKMAWWLSGRASGIPSMPGSVVRALLQIFSKNSEKVHNIIPEIPSANSRHFWNNIALFGTWKLSCTFNKCARKVSVYYKIREREV
jgi:hypothetical protein